MSGFGGANPIGGDNPQPQHRPQPSAPQGYGPRPGPGGGGGYGGPPTPPPAPPTPPPAPPGAATGYGGGYPNPPQQHPNMGPPGPGFPATSYAPAPKSRRKLFLAIGAAVVTVVAVVAGVIVYSSVSEPDTSTAGGTVKAYLLALAEGDAQKALSFGIADPPDKTFLTDEILKKQIEKAPIKNIEIVSEDTNSVHVTANFGDTPVDQEVQVKASADGAWKLENAAYSLDFNKDDKASGPTTVLDSTTILGKPLPQSGIAYLFPGPIEVGNSNANVTTTVKDDANYLEPLTYSGPKVNANWKVDISDEGKKGALEAINAYLAECAKSNSFNPPNCPNDELMLGYMQDGTAQWTAPTLTDDDVKFNMIDLSGQARVTANPEFTVTGKGLRPQFDANNKKATYLLFGVADLLKTPPTFEYRKSPF